MFMDVAAKVFLGWACVAGVNEGLRALVGEHRSRKAASAEMQKELDRFWGDFPLEAIGRELPPLQLLTEIPDATPPTRAEVMQTVAQSDWISSRREGLTYRTAKQRDKLGAPRFIPLAGPSQLREVRWNCTVTYDLEIEIGMGSKLRLAIPCTREINVELRN